MVNKWDLMHDEMPTERWATYLRDQLSFGEVPIRMHLDKREREDRRTDVESRGR